MRLPSPIPVCRPFLSLGLILFCFFICNRTNASVPNALKSYTISQDSLPPDSLKNGLPAEIEHFINGEIEFKVPVMTCQQLHEMQDNGRRKLAILDARSPKEFNMSHIKDARRVGYDDFSPDKVWFVDKETVVVIYCQVGKKSEHIGLELKKMGFKEIYNLYGSIIEWVNQDLPVVDKNGNPTKKVYTHNKKERRMLRQMEINN